MSSKQYKGRPVYCVGLLLNDLNNHLKKGNIMIINFTQHNATPEQIQAGVVDIIPTSIRSEFLTFTDIPSAEEIRIAAQEAVNYIGTVSKGGERVMIGGAPFFISALERELKAAGYTPVYAFSERISVDVVQSDGTVVKTSRFAHKGFVEV